MPNKNGRFPLAGVPVLLPCHLPLLPLGYSSAVHDSTGSSPYLLMMGREPRLRAEAALGSATTTETSHETLSADVDHLRQGVQKPFNFARQRTDATNVNNRALYMVAN